MTAILTETPSQNVSERMRKVRNKGSKIEVAMEKILRLLYLEYTAQPKMVAHPDFILNEAKVAIFCDSSFWHGNPKKPQSFKTNKAFWEKKINDNINRDEVNNEKLKQSGWQVLRFWDYQILNDAKNVARTIMMQVNPLPQKHLAVVELFCGAGGLAHGFFLEGVNVVAGFDIDKTCKFSYEKNNLANFSSADLEQVKGEEIKKLYPADSIKVLAGCAPCQPFSPYAHNTKKSSDKWKLLYTYTRLVNEIEPDIITMENVPTLLSYNHGQVLSDFTSNLAEKGYHTWFKIVKCPDYGIPQYRRRLVLLASKFGDISLIEKTHSPGQYLRVIDAIGDLPSIEAGSVNKTDPLHRSRNLTPKNLERIKATKEGEDWRSWPENLRLDCHKRESGKSFGSVYGRMRWNEPSPTITTEFIGVGNGRFGHPTQNRAISLREASLLQTFPFYYDFIDPTVGFSAQRIAIHIGNAVPVRLGQIIAKSIKEHVKQDAK